MNELRGAALAYAERGWRVFPVHGIVNGVCTCGRECGSPGKHPLVRRGLHEATAEPRVIKEWWRGWRSANIGIATGAESGVVVIDVDLYLRSRRSTGEGKVQGEDQNDVWDSLDSLIGRLPRTLTGLTGGGGLHLLYRLQSDRHLRNHAGSLPGIGDLAGVDLRGNGGYIVAPPSVHTSGSIYSWLEPHRTIADAPEWLEEAPRHNSPGAPQSPPRFAEGEGTPYGLAALDGALISLRCAPIGQRNHTLNREAFSLAQLVAGGELLEAAARSALLGVALAIGLDESESRQTLDSAFDAGLRLPRVAPHRMKPGSVSP